MVDSAPGSGGEPVASWLGGGLQRISKHVLSSTFSVFVSGERTHFAGSPQNAAEFLHGIVVSRVCKRHRTARFLRVSQLLLSLTWKKSN